MNARKSNGDEKMPLIIQCVSETLIFTQLNLHELYANTKNICLLYQNQDA